MRRNKSHKITFEIAVEMRLEYAADVTLTHGDMARKYGISTNQAGKILRNEVWIQAEDRVALRAGAEPSPALMQRLAAESSARLAADPEMMELMNKQSATHEPPRTVVEPLGPDGLTDSERKEAFKGVS